MSFTCWQIDPKNDYMVEHLQHSLVQIARRVVSRYQNSSTTYDQNSSIIYADSSGAEVCCHGHCQSQDEDDNEGYVPTAGSYTRSVKGIRKLVSREDTSLVVMEQESGSDYIRRHLEQSSEDDNEEENGQVEDLPENTTAAETQESSSDFILRHLAEANAEEKGEQKLQKDDKKSELEETSSDYIRRHLAEAGVDEQHPEAETSEDRDSQQDKGEEEEEERQRGASKLYEEYQAKCSEERDLLCASGRAGGQLVEVDDVSLEDTVAQISASISLGAFYLNKRINTKVSMRLIKSVFQELLCCDAMRCDVCLRCQACVSRSVSL